MQHEHVPPSRSLRAAAWLASFLLGCAGEEPLEPSADARAQTTSLPAPMRDGGSVVPYVATIKANGTGCRAGTWNTVLSSDGTTFVTTFSGFEASVTAGRAVAGADCSLAVQLKSELPLSYAVTYLLQQGYAYLEPGVRAFQESQFYAAGAPAVVDQRELRVDMVGPYDDVYRLEHQVADADTVWTPCGHDRLQTVRTRMLVRRTEGTGDGYMTMATVDNHFASKLVFKLSWRTCQDRQTDAGAGAPSDAASTLDAGLL